MSEERHLCSQAGDYENFALARSRATLRSILVKFRLLRFLCWIILVVQLLLQGRLLDRLAHSIRHRFRFYREHGGVLDYQKSFLAKIDPRGILKSSGAQKKKFEPSGISFPVVKIPVVSIIIPCYGKVDYTLRCLSSLAEIPPETPFEIIVAEDASGDPDCAKLRNVRGITYIERKKNMGFLRSCNDAAKHARGAYIFLLNNDTYVMRGAVDALVRLLRERPDAGMVGARLIYPDGVQQEAGGIVWRDGSAWNYGRHDSALKPEYCYVREADYISGAAIMLPRDTWNKLGGFDEHFLPAYCEDSDLAFRIRREGLKVLYQPEAWVIHYEGVSHGTDVNSGIKAYQIENNNKLKKRWGDVLLKDHFPSGTRLLRARDRAAHCKVTLVVDHYVPEPDRDAGSRTMMCFIEALLKTGRVVKFWPDNRYASPRYTEDLQQRGVEVLYGETTGGFARWIKENGVEVDEVLLSRPTVAPAYIALLRQHTRAPIIFYGHDLHHARMRLEAEITKDLSKKLAAMDMMDKEISVCKSVDCALYPSEEEVCTIQEIDPMIQAGTVSPYALAEATPRKSLQPGNVDILFVAGFAHAPNVDAALWFHDYILPLIRAQKPGVRVALVGSNPTEEVKSLANDNIKVTGFVTDAELATYYATARVAVSPLRFGAGVKFKVVEGMHAGLPLVTTPIGAQGLKNLDGVLEICNDAESFAKAVLRFLDDDSLWLERSARQIEYVNRTFSCETQKREIEGAFARAAENRNRKQKK
jgi:GT2 family glycosyltransferase